MKTKLSTVLMLLGLLVVLIPCPDFTALGAARALARVDITMWWWSPSLTLQAMEIELARVQHEEPVPVLIMVLPEDIWGLCVYDAILLDWEHVFFDPPHRVVDTLVHEHRHLMQLRGLPGGALLHYNLLHYEENNPNQPVERDAALFAIEVVNLWMELLER